MIKQINKNKALTFKDIEKAKEYVYKEGYFFGLDDIFYYEEGVLDCTKLSDLEIKALRGTRGFFANNIQYFSKMQPSDVQYMSAKVGNFW